MSLFSSKKSATYTLSIALKSSSIDVQLIANLGDIKQVLLSERKIIVLTNSQDSHAYTKQCISELGYLLKKNTKDINQLSGGRIKETKVVLYAPWFTSHITPITHKESVMVTEKFLHHQLEGVKTPSKLVNLEKKVINVLTNGYKVTELGRTKLNNISLEIYSSYIAETIYEVINKTTKEAVPIIDKIAYLTSPILIFEQIKNLLVREDNISFLYVGGEITEVGVIEDDTLSFYSTFPIGKHDFLRQVQSTVQTYDYDLLYQKQVQIKSKTKQDEYESLKGQWSDLVLNTLLSFKKDVPSKILIISDSKTRDFFTDLLKNKIKDNPQTSFGQYRIINFDISHLKDIIQYKTPINTDELDLQLEALM